LRSSLKTDTGTKYFKFCDNITVISEGDNTARYATLSAYSYAL
jgi:hypothetical protein